MIDIKVDDGQLKIYLDKFNSRVLDAIKKEIGIQSLLLKDYVVVNHLRGGTSADKLGVRTGLLWKSAHVLEPKYAGEGIEGGMGVGGGVPYAKVHINKSGVSTTIRSKGKLLTIPVGPANTKGGASRRAGARSWPDLFFVKSRQGNKLLVKKGAGDNLIPYFVLKDSVTIKSRVHPELILQKMAPKIIEGIKTAVERVL